VQIKLTPTNGRPEFGADKSATELVAALTADQYNQLLGFARYRLRAVQRSRALQRALTGVEPEDLIAEAILKLQLGDEDPLLGRHLRPEHRANPQRFLACIKGIIESDLNHLVTAARTRYEHVEIGEPEQDADAADPAEADDPHDRLSRRDLQRVLFQKIHERITRQPALLGVVRDWEARFLDDDRINDGSWDSNLSKRVRQLAREILDELSAELNLSGREMLL